MSARSPSNAKFQSIAKSPSIADSSNSAKSPSIANFQSSASSWKIANFPSITKKSFTLIEVMVAVWIVATVFLSLVTLHLQNIQAVRRTVETAIALSIAMEYSTLTYIETKHNIEIQSSVESRWTDWEIESDVVDFSTLISTIVPLNIQVPPVPYFKVRSPSGVEIEFLGR